MAADAPDLTQDITFRSVSLNSWAMSLVAGQTVVVGNRVTMFDMSDVQLRQFTEPLALVDGLDVGGVWQGGRKLIVHGVTLDKTRGECYDRLAALEAVMLPESGTFGVYDLVWKAISTSSGSLVTKTLSVRPNGLRYTIADVKAGHQGSANDVPIAIPWAVTFLAKNPAIS